MVQQTMARSKSPTTRKQHQREEKSSYSNDDSIEGSYQSRRHRKGNTSSLTTPTDNYNVNPALYGWHATINARNNRDTPTNKKFNHAMKYQRRRSSFNSTRDLRAAIAKANQSSVVNTNYAEAVARRTANRRHHKRQSIERSASFDEVTKRESELMDESSTTKIFKAMFGSGSKTKGCDACDDLEKDVSNRSTKERVKAMFNMSFSRNDDEEDAYDYTRRRDSDDSEDSMDESFSTTKQRIWNMFKSDNNNAGQESDSYLQMSSSARSATKGAGKKLKKLFIGKRDSEIEDLGNDVLLSYGICKGFSYTD